MELHVFNTHEVGIDIGNKIYNVAIVQGNTHEVRHHDSFAEDLESLVC